MKKLITVVFIFFLSVETNAQKGTNNMLHEKFWTCEFNLTNNGYSFNYSRGLITNVHTRKFLEIEFANIHNSKEYKQTKEIQFQPNDIPNPKPFIYGKQNSFYNLNFSFGIYKELGRRADRAGVSVGVKAIGGFSLGILKPYSLVLVYPIDNFRAELKYETYTEENKNIFLDINSIYGGGLFSNGLTHIKFIPGAHTKLGIHFDYAIYDEYLKAIEAGIQFNAYYKSVPLMLIEKNQQFYPGIYVGFEFGKKS